MAVAPDSKEILSFKELFTSQVVQQEAITRLLGERDIHQGKVFGDC